MVRAMHRSLSKQAQNKSNKKLLFQKIKWKHIFHYYYLSYHVISVSGHRLLLLQLNFKL